MLSSFTPVPTIATSDVDRARAFYETTLGLSGDPSEEAGGVFYACGASGFLLYPSAYAGTNKATAMSFQVERDGFDAEVARLRAAGVTFDTFDLEGVQWVDGVATSPSGSAVWFSDPDGNILNVTTMPS